MPLRGDFDQFVIRDEFHAYSMVIWIGGVSRIASSLPAGADIGELLVLIG